MSEGRYVRFTPKQDNSNELISAEHINTIQDTAERTQQAIFKTQDRDFLDKALFILDHHRKVNGLWVDVFSDISKIDLVRTRNLTYSEAEQGIVFPDGSIELEGHLYSKAYVNENSSLMKKMIVIARKFEPEGTHITVEVSNNNADWYEPPLGESDVIELPTDGQKIYLRAIFTRSNNAISPRLDAWAVLFHDPRRDIIKMPNGDDIVIVPPGGDGNDYTDLIDVMHNQLLGIGTDDHHPQEHSHDGLDGSGRISHKDLIQLGEDDHHPKNHQHGQDGVDPVNLESDVVGTLHDGNLSYKVWTGHSGDTGLHFDPMIGDKLVYVKTPDDETYLFYDLSVDRISHTITLIRGIAVWERFIFGTYIDSKGKPNVVLQGTEKIHYDATDALVLQEIQSLVAPNPPNGLVVQDPGTGVSLNLSWAGNTEFNLVGYNVYKRRVGETVWTKANTMSIIASESFTVTGLSDGATYEFVITAVDSKSYESNYSLVASGTVTISDTIPPLPPENLQVFNAGFGAIKVTWDPNTEPDLLTYTIYRSDSGMVGTYIPVQTVPVGSPTEWIDSGLLPTHRYYYYITASDALANESIPSLTFAQEA